MDAIRADQNVAARGVCMGPAAIEEIGAHPTLVLGECAETAAGPDSVLSQPLQHGLMDDALQATAMDGELRDLVTGIEPTLLVPDLLAVPGQIEQFRGADRNLIETI